MNNIKFNNKLVKLSEEKSDFFNNIKIIFSMLALIIFIQSCQTKNEDIKDSLVNPIKNFAITKKKCRGSDVTFWNNCLGTFNYDNGNKYIGEYKNGKINGQGKFFYKSGAIYDGNNKDGLAHGFGSLTFKNGDKYEGYFLKDKYHGAG
ncbi:hypothetical protein OBA40_03660, partial [Alphaproteobacteria bacterium]|nr:hypothetical protein [Alphaproteobacteria bacterium]